MTEIINLIRTESVGTIEETLDFWLYECSLDEAPTHEEVALWEEELKQRGGKFLRLAQICRTWQEEEA